jgi:hypothetical protein
MSFDALKKSDVTKKTKDVLLKVGDVEYKFKANEISYLQRLNIASAQANGGDPFSLLLVYSIVDQDGNHMTVEQAQALDSSHAEALFLAASEVNKTEDKKK